VHILKISIADECTANWQDKPDNFLNDLNKWLFFCRDVLTVAELEYAWGQMINSISFVVVFKSFCRKLIVIC
jgi:hypothetical protein